MPKFSFDQKAYLEATAANTFCQAYSGLYQVSAVFDRLNLPRKPDVTVCIDGLPQDLEIAHLYSCEEEAKQLKNTFQGIMEHSEEIVTQCSLSMLPMKGELVEALGTLLDKKSTKCYASSSPWLVIRNASPKWQRQDFERALTALQMPNTHPFHQIWLIPDLTAEQGLIRLYP